MLYQYLQLLILSSLLNQMLWEGLLLCSKGRRMHKAALQHPIGLIPVQQTWHPHSHPFCFFSHVWRFLQSWPQKSMQSFALSFRISGCRSLCLNIQCISISRYALQCSWFLNDCKRLWHPKVIFIFPRYCYSKGIKRNSHCTLFFRHYKQAISI